MSVIVLAFAEKLKLHPTEPFWPDGGKVGQGLAGSCPRRGSGLGRQSVRDGVVGRMIADDPPL